MASGQPAEGALYRVFISHAGEDKFTLAQPLFEKLESKGLSPFLDVRAFLPGDQSHHVMNSAMETAPVGVFILSPEFLAKGWTMKELECFVGRFDQARAANAKPALLLPVFYRLSKEECTDPDVFFKYADIFIKWYFSARVMNGETSIERVISTMMALSQHRGIQNEEGATNSKWPPMAITRHNLVNRIYTFILDELGIPSDNDPLTADVSASLVDTFRPSRFVPSNMPYVYFENHVEPNTRDTRPAYDQQVKNHLLGYAEPSEKVVAIVGPPGVGKTCILKELAINEAVLARFIDGFAYVSLGKDATPRTFMSQLCIILRNFGALNTSQELARNNDLSLVLASVRQWFEGRSVLFLVDDLWSRNGLGAAIIADMMSLCSSNSSVVFSMRDRRLAANSTELVTVNAREPKGNEARHMLLSSSHFRHDQIVLEENVSAFEMVLELCAGLPLSIVIAGQSVAALVQTSKEDLSSQREKVWSLYMSRYHTMRIGIEGDVLMTSGDGHPGLSASLRVALEILEEKASRTDELSFGRPFSFLEMFVKLCVLGKQDWAPFELLTRLWEVSNANQAKEIAMQMISVGIMNMRVSLSVGRPILGAQIHDLVHEFTVRKATAARGVQREYRCLLDNYICDLVDSGEDCHPWWSPSVPDDRYFHFHLCRLLEGAHFGAEIVALLLRPEWTGRKLDIGGIRQFEQDIIAAVRYVNQGTDGPTSIDKIEALELISDAARLSSQFIARNPGEVWFQLYGRFFGGRGNRFIQRYLHLIEQCAPSPWIRSTSPLLIQAGQACTGILKLNSTAKCIASTPTSGRFVCGCSDGKLVLLDVFEGCVLNEVNGHNGSVTAIAVTVGGKVISGSDDSFLKVWDVHTLTLERVMKGHSGGITSVAVSVDGKRVVSGSLDASIRVWGVLDGQLQFPAFQAVGTFVHSVFALPNGRFIGCWGDGRVAFLNGETGRKVGNDFDIRNLSSKSQKRTELVSVNLSPDARFLYVTDMIMMRRWNIETGMADKLDWTLGSHFFWFEKGLVSSKNNRTVISAVLLGALRIFDCESGTETCGGLYAESGNVTGMVFMEGDKKVVVCFENNSVQTWDVSRMGQEQLETNSYGLRPYSLCSSSDGSRFVIGADTEIVLVLEN